MADDNTQNPKDESNEFESEEEGLSGPESEEDEGGLGNLPPLSNFDSGEDGDSGLPPLEELSVETPTPSGGQIKPPQPGYEGSRSSDKPGDSDPFEIQYSDSDLDTPQPREKAGFQDLAADSDFSPETPDMGPGPDEDQDTPMFDSAFGEGTGAPTQAMETPMFDSGGDEGQGFDAGAFGGGDEDFAPAATPAPDFSPDTGVSGGRPTPPPAVVQRGGGGGGGILLAIILLIVGLLVGIVAGPYVATRLAFMPNPLQNELERVRAENERLRGIVAEAPRFPGVEEPPTIEELEQLRSQINQAQTELTNVQSALQEVQAEYQQAQTELALTREDIEIRQEEYVATQDALESIRNELSVNQARQEGLVAEIRRLTNQVGQLEEADARRIATRDALDHDLQRLALFVREGMPLTPPRFDRDERVEKVRDLRDRVQAANWVNADVLHDYTSLFLQELEIARSREYFFARVPVVDPLGNREVVWAECLMNGNWSVYFRSIDGRYTGIYADVSDTATPRYEFNHTLPEAVQARITPEILEARVPGSERQIELLHEKARIRESRTNLQRLYDSLGR